MKILILGAGGIVGQEMAKRKPVGVEVVALTSRSWFLSSRSDVYSMLDSINPDCIVNLAGQNNVDIVEKTPEDFAFINTELSGFLSLWAFRNNAKLIQASTQAVFKGDKPPYKPDDEVSPISKYGEQKARAEDFALSFPGNLVARLTFVYGIRPDRKTGRVNPLEIMMSPEPQLQVDDKFFSPLWAKDAADILYDLCLGPQVGIVHLGQPISMSRYRLACYCAWETHRNLDIKPVPDKFFENTVNRPDDTTWAFGSLFNTDVNSAILESYLDWREDEKC